MTGETQHAYAIPDTESGSKDKDFVFERYGEKEAREYDGGLPDSSELGLHSGAESAPPFPSAKDKEPHSQREAVIRPQQAGKIDFKSLHNRPAFAGDGAWGGVKGSPQSPPGKSRAREKGRRAGKGERGHHQLYRLSIANARPNPTIGIAYPQQKVIPPKKLEVPRGPISGSYRFHVPSIPEREAELQQEDLGFGRCFPEASSSLTSTSYTSQATTTARQNHAAKGQSPVGVPHKSPGAGGQLHYLDFQANGVNSWPSPEKIFPGATYGLSAPKAGAFPESGKSGARSPGSLPFPYPCQPVQDAVKESYHNDASSQDYMDVSLAVNQVTHGAFSFHSSSRDWQDEALSNGSYDTVVPEGRAYSLPSQPAQFLPSQAPGVHHQSPLPCYKGRNEHSTDLNGAISSSGAIDQNPSTFQESQAVFPSSLHTPTMPKPVSKRQCTLKDGVPGPRILAPGSSLRRNMPQNSVSQVHFQNKVYCSSAAGGVSAASVPFEKSIPTTAQPHPRLLQAWDGASKAFPPLDPSSAPYSNPVGNQFSFECQSGPEQRQHVQKSSRMPWQQIHLTSAMPSQNRIELSRQITSQKFPFPLGTSEWPGGGKIQKGPPLTGVPGYHSKKLLPGDGLRSDAGQQPTNAFSFEGRKEAGSPGGDARSKALFYSLKQAAPARNPPALALALPAPTLVGASPRESPLPSPVPNPAGGSTCSSLSPMSASPGNPSFEDSQLPPALAPSPFYPHPCHPKDVPALHYQPPEAAKSFHFPADASKDEPLLKCLPEAPYHKAGLDGLEGEPPPPPYLSHHLLANSLSSASLDQLDVLLTCKQCDQNYSNLSSFLEHRQFCGSHAVFQAETKDGARGAEGRKPLLPDPAKHPQPGLGLGLPLAPDSHSPLLTLSKNVDFLLDGEAKDDPLKANLFHGLAVAAPPLTASDLEIDDAKLDSLITEALNGLGYQSDNPEIDSSFMDVFVDEELTSAKAAGSGAPYKPKDTPESKQKHPGAEEKPKTAFYYEEDRPSEEATKSRTSGRQHVHKGRPAGRFASRGAQKLEKLDTKELDRSRGADRVPVGKAEPNKSAKLRAGRKGSTESAAPAAVPKPGAEKKPCRNATRDPRARSDARPSAPSPAAASKSAKPPRFSMKDGKKRKLRSGTWSKELIHKIVQQKNKLHKLHVKSNANMQFSLVTERLLPAPHDGQFGEYDYISDSEDDGADYAALPGRRKPGSGFNGRPKRSFSQRRSGKEKEPAWLHSQKRGSQEQRRAPGSEAGKKDEGTARARRSSTGSRRSTSLSSETSASPPGTEQADSDAEKGGEHAAPLPPSPSDATAPKKSHKSKGGFSRGTRRFGSAKCPPTGSTVSPAEGQEQRARGEDASSTSPLPRYRREASHAEETARPVPEAPDLAAASQRGPFAPYNEDALRYHSEELIAAPHLGHEASPGHASYSETGIKYLKEHGLCGDRKDYGCYSRDGAGMMLAVKEPATYVNAEEAFYDPKDLSDPYDANLFSKPPPLGSSHMDEMYLCQADMNAGSFKQKEAGLSAYAAESQRAKVSSPLSFDSSSIFEELPVAEFDAPLYSSVSASKDSYVMFACAGNPPGKAMPFEQQYPPFLQEKEWALMEDVPPILAEDIPPFHGLSVEKPLAKKFPHEGTVASGQMSLPLPERVTDYNVPFMNNASEDELEIKRLVTELENQLQTNKLHKEAPAVHQKVEQRIGTQLRDASGQFSPLPVDQEMSNEKRLFLADGLGSAGLLAPKVCVSESLGTVKPAAPDRDGSYGSHRDAWPCPVEFGSLDSSMCAPAPDDPIPVDHFCPKKACDQFQEAETPKETDSRETASAVPDSCVPTKTEAPIYTERAMKSPAISDPSCPSTLKAADLSEQDMLPPLPSSRGPEGFPLPGKMEESFDDPPELGPFGSHAANLKSEFGLQEERVLAFSSHPKNVPDSQESPLSKSASPEGLKSAVHFGGDESGSALLEEAGESKEPAPYPSPGPCDKGSDRKALLFDILSLPKEAEHGTEKAGAQETAANPLQQLQLFVARTVKNNEEELMMPCFPMLLSASHQPPGTSLQAEQKEESVSGAESEDATYCHARVDGTVPLGEAIGLAAGSEENGHFSGAGEQLDPFPEAASYALKQSAFMNEELHNTVTELQHLANECSEPGDINTHPDGVSQEHNNLSPLGYSARTPLPGQGQKSDQIVKEQEQDKNKATLAFKKHRQSYLSHRSFEKETVGKALPETLNVGDADCGPWCDGAGPEVQLSRAAKHSGRGSTSKGAQEPQPLSHVPLAPASPLNPAEDLQREDRFLHETNVYLVNAQMPKEGGCTKMQALEACHYKEDSLGGLPLRPSFSHQKYLQSTGTENLGFSSFGARLPEGDQYGASLLTAETQSSLFLVERCPSDSENNPICHPAQSPGVQSKWKGALLFPPTPQHCNTAAPAPREPMGSIQRCLAEDLNNFQQPEKEELARPPAPLCPDDLAAAALDLESHQKLQLKDCALSCFDQKDVGQEPQEGPGAAFLGPHYNEGKAGATMKSQPAPLRGSQAAPETSSYSAEPMNLLPMRKQDAESNLSQKQELEKGCHEGHNQRSKPETSSAGFVVQQVPTAASPGLNTTDPGPLDGGVQHFSETRAGDHCKSLDGKEGTAEGDGSGSGGGAGSCVRNSTDREDDGDVLGALPSASRKERAKEKKQNGLQVTCDICSASFRSKPGLTRHKAVKHRMKNDSITLPSKVSRPRLIPLDKASRLSRKGPRKGAKGADRERAGNSQVPAIAAAALVPRKAYAGPEKEPNAQIQEVVSRVLSDLSVVSLGMSQELRCTDMPSKDPKPKYQCTVVVEDLGMEKPDPKKHPGKREKGRRSQSKDPEGFSSNSERKLSRKVRRRKAKMFPNKSEAGGLCASEEDTRDIPSQDTLGTSRSGKLEDVAEVGDCVSAEALDRPRSPQPSPAAEPAPRAAGPSEEVVEEASCSQETASRDTGELRKAPNGGEEARAEEKWSTRLVKQVEKGLSQVCKEQHEDGDGTVVKGPEATESSLGEGSHGKWSSALKHPSGPATPDRPAETRDAAPAPKDPAPGGQECASDGSPRSSEPRAWGQGEAQPSKERSTGSVAEPDLQSLFDDDTTFSQLFPRDDQFTRRKCTRVYGKRTKKPKPISEANIKPIGTEDLFSIRLASDLSETSSFCVTRDDPCEYETISIDDALMLNMCHNSKPKGHDAVSSPLTNLTDYKRASQEKEVIDLEEDNVLTFLCQNNRMENVPNLTIWGSLDKEVGSVPTNKMLFKPLAEPENERLAVEASPEPPDLEEEPYDSKANTDPNSPEFHAVDIEMLNAKFKMRDVCFVSSGEDNPVHPDDSTVSFKQKPGQHSKHSKNKAEDGKAGKNRSDLNLKTKDKQYKCKVCFQWFLTLGELDFHKLTHNPSPPPTCYMCVQRKFSSREQLRDHLKEKHAKNKAGLWACGMCLKEISDVWMYNEHLREHATQFARKGQAQKSVMGLPACFSEDNAAVTHFLNTIMYRKPSKSSRHVESSSSKPPACKENKSQREQPLEQEAKVVKDLAEMKPPSCPSSSSKASSIPSPEHMPKCESAPKAVPMHPDCKDPSRDCHHCGKQFPKPFKLQRHLVVHSLQKIYLCHKCPMFYQETKELRNHLGHEHGIVEEPEIKHTTLYACELCADVMHVIKKSFICSMCNYTFSKKEQYDRHMEKHLSGSSKTFKFRGVMRPGLPSKDGNEKIKEESSPREDVPPSKKRKVGHHASLFARSSPVYLDPNGNLQLGEDSLTPPSEPFPAATGSPEAPLPQTSVKTEDLVGDFSELLAEMEKSPFGALPPPACLSPSGPQAIASDPELSHIATLSVEDLEKGAFDGKHFLDSSEFSMDLTGLACNQAEDEKRSPPHLTEKHGHADVQEKATLGNNDEDVMRLLDDPSPQESLAKETHFLKLAKKVPELPVPRAEAPQAKEANKPLLTNLNVNDTAPKDSAHHSLPLKDKTASPVLNRAAKDLASQKKTVGSQVNGEAALNTTSAGGNPEEVLKPCSLKDKAMPETGAFAKDSSANTNIKEIGSNQNKPLSSQLKGEPVKHSHLEAGKSSDKRALNGTGKLHPKKRKEHKSLSHKGSSASRENIEGDGKKKKGRTPGPGRSESAGELKRADWTSNEASALSPGRRETHCNKLIPKPRVVGVGHQLKKMVLDTYNQKKVEIRQTNGDLKRKKDILGKTFHHLLAKGPGTSLHGAIGRHRTVQGAKPADSHNYRTAESQNNLLSQLFGQKLTSFKIPLRRDTSE
ncbi:PREDICTED: zinc finger protein 469 [Crocodylus porosus]|uniref:Zinc finger protein 469 n=1 Tax=Crocodylus porosus TaxID=8502 RepID=A0A7M4FV77_CROPO|nr:PREDICTED: zinc finger protein 469 [Crocodylus porosus]